MKPLFYLLILFTFPQCSTAGEDLYRLPLNQHGEISMEQLGRTFLQIRGGEGRPAFAMKDQFFALDTPLGGLLVGGWNMAMAESGIRMQLNGRSLDIRVNKQKAAANKEQLGQWMNDVLGIEEPKFALHRVSPPAATGPTLIFIHGMDSGPFHFEAVGKRLSNIGYRVFLFEYPNDGGVVPAATELTNRIRRMSPQERGDISLIGYSMGGVIGRHCIEAPEFYSVGIKRFIAFAAPFKGSELAPFRSWLTLQESPQKFIASSLGLTKGGGQAGIDLKPGSAYLRQTAGWQRHPKVTYSSIAGNKPFVDAQDLVDLKATLDAIGFNQAIRDYGNSALAAAASAGPGKGDGAVAIDSTRLAGVRDHIILDLSHPDFLYADDPSHVIPAYAELIKRLPKIQRAAPAVPRRGGDQLIRPPRSR